MAVLVRQVTKNYHFEEIFAALNSANLPRSEFVQFMEKIHNPFIVLIACILSLRTNDRTTYPATLRMLKLAKTPEEFAKLDKEVLAEAIKPVGFYKNKASQIIELSKIIVKDLKGKTPDTIEDLIKFNGVGRKTANLTLAKGHNKPGICVDVHVHRISNRIGWVKTNMPDETEMELRKILPDKFWIEINTLFVTLGQNLCRPTKPKCNFCPIANYCDFNK
ncbi:endonuclease III [bacterium]|nr:endonuclease III [bacterium]